MNTAILFRRVIAAGLAAAALLFPATSHAVMLTYDVRVTGDSNQSTVITDPHNVLGVQFGDVLTIQLYAVINGTDGTHFDDGFLRGSGSFIGQANTFPLFGTLRGDTTGGPATLQNNVSLFSGSGAQSGFQADLDGDGDLDVGSLAQTGNPAGPPWFVAMGAGQQAQFGIGPGLGSTEFLIGQTTFTVTGAIPNPQADGLSTTLIEFLPQIKTDGTSSDQMLNQFIFDGAPAAYNGNDPNVATIGATLIGTPEPSACAMMLCGVSALAGFRRRR